MIPFKLEKLKKIQRKKRYGLKCAQSLLHNNANYDLKNNNSHKLYNYQIAPYAWDFLPIKFF